MTFGTRVTQQMLLTRGANGRARRHTVIQFVWENVSWTVAAVDADERAALDPTLRAIVGSLRPLRGP